MRKNLFVVILLAVVIFVSECMCTEAVIYNNGTDCALEFIPESVLKEHLISEEVAPISAAFPAVVDLSTSQYFPSIQNQGSLGSCSAFATVYYQFTYEANKLNNVNSKELNNCYSPKWVYNSLNKGINTGISVEKAYKFLKEHGSMKWKDFPYTQADYNILPGSSYADKMREALNCRLSEWYSYKISGTGTSITDNNDSDLDIIKSALLQGHPLVVQTYCDWDVRNSDTWGKVLIACGKSSGGHAMTVVGYNDNVWIDVNGNGNKDAGECGAFKLANSWGNHGTTTNGYMWVLYDALNQKSSISGNTQQLENERVSMFSFGVSDNYFTSIEVENKEVQFVAEVDLEAKNANQLRLSYGKYRSTLNDCGVAIQFGQYAFGQPAAYKGVVMIDMGEVMSSMYANYTGYKWYVTVKHVKNNSDSTSGIFNVSYNITDNLGKKIADGGNIASVVNGSKQLVANVNLLLGDVDYSGKVNSDDAMLVLKYFAGTEQFSNAQKFLGDCNGDGKVDSDDAQLILSGFAGK